MDILLRCTATNLVGSPGVTLDSASGVSCSSGTCLFVLPDREGRLVSYIRVWPGFDRGADITLNTIGIQDNDADITLVVPSSLVYVTLPDEATLLVIK